MHKKYFNLLILIFLLISLLFYFSFVKAENPEGKRFVLDAKLVLGGEQCGRNEGFIQEGMFYDNQNTLIRFCVKKADYSANNSYVTKLVFENLRERGTCEEGEERGSFIDKEGNRVALCLKVAQYSGEGKIAEEAKLSSDDCDRGYEKSSANLQEEIFLCVKYFGRASCGNNIKEENERCDGTDLAGRTCASFGFSQGNLKCKPDCTFDTSNCLYKTEEREMTIRNPGQDNQPRNIFGWQRRPPRDTGQGCAGASSCGNGIKEENKGEECDKGRNNSDNGVCKKDCKLNVCGDGKRLSNPIISDPPDGVRDIEQDNYEECDDGNNLDGDGCSSDCKNETLCDKETELACYLNNKGAGWCCSKWDDKCMPMRCGPTRNDCLYNIRLSSLSETDPDSAEKILENIYNVNYLNLNKEGIPEHCSCERTTLLLLGDVTTEGYNQGIKDFFGTFSYSKYCQLKQRFDKDCTFLVDANLFPIEGELFRAKLGKKIKNLVIITHGSKKGTSIGNFNASFFGGLACSSESRVDTLSCLVGRRPLAGGILGLEPVFVEQFCQTAPLGTQIRVSESPIVVKEEKFNLEHRDLLSRLYGICDYNEPDCGIFCSGGDFDCYECIGAGKAKQVKCEDSIIPTFGGSS